VAITFVTRGNARGETRLALDDWAGLEQAEREVHGLRVTDDSGQPLAVERAHGGGHAEHGAAWTVHHPPGAVLHVHYAIVSTQDEVGDDSSSYYRPLLQPTFFHTIGNTSLLYAPTDSRDGAADPTLHIDFHWRGFAEAGWKVASSFSVEQDFQATETSEHFRHAVFIAGELHLVRRDIGPTKSPLWLAVAGSDWGFSDDALADTAAKIVQAQRAFFDDYRWPYFLISVIPVGRFQPGSYSRGGTGLTQSFGLFLTPKSDLGAENDGAGIRWLLSHELFHLWNGNRYELTDPEPLGYWFSEGFTDFYARRLLFRSGLAGIGPFVQNLDDKILHYTLSPVRKEPATRIAADFWKDRAIEKLPYLRGDVVALVVDAEIRKVSHGEKGLDDLMKELLAVRKDPTPKATPETFLALIERYTSPAFVARIRKVVVDGAPLDVDPKLLEPCLHARIDQVGPYDIGFDLHVAHTRHEVAGVVPGSVAYKAGLRNGQRFATWSYDDDPRHPVDITVLDGAAKRTVRYLPQGKPRPVVQFYPDATPSPACAKLL
jgi:predicted metalloprotease with PDZ domain